MQLRKGVRAQLKERVRAQLVFYIELLLENIKMEKVHFISGNFIQGIIEIRIRNVMIPNFFD